MANDNRESQLAAMAEQTAAATDETSKDRKGPYYNCTNEIIAMIDHAPAEGDESPAGMIQQWMTEEPAGAVRDALVSAFETFRDRLIAKRDLPRDTETTAGRWYVGIGSEGQRSKFKSPSVPKESNIQFKSFKIVLGPYHVENGASYVVANGRRSKDTLVFHRAGVAKDLGARADYAAELNGQ